MNVQLADLDQAFRDDQDSVDGDDPFGMFDEWFELAQGKEINDANAMAIATSDSSGLPNVRMVLLKSADRDGFVFYTNAESQKGIELQANMQAAAVLHWKSLRRQIRFRGQVSPVSQEEADAYFASRARASQIGAWASRQSRVLDSRFALKKAVASVAAQYGLGTIPRPSYWTGFRIVPSYIEFWMDKPFRLHDRLIFERVSPADRWTAKRFFP